MMAYTLLLKEAGKKVRGICFKILYDEVKEGTGTIVNFYIGKINEINFQSYPQLSLCSYHGNFVPKINS